MIYNYGKGNDKNWIVAADEFGHDKGWLYKYEPVMCIGNGYMCMRASTEEKNEYEIRSTLVSGTFDKYGDEVTCLPICADLSTVEIFVDGQRMNLRKGVLSGYFVSLNFKTGVLSRSFDWTSPAGKQINFKSERIISYKDLHLYATRLTVTALCDAKIEIVSGINGKADFGAPHFIKKSAAVKEDYLQYVQTTQESGIDFIATVVNKCDKGVKTSEKGRLHLEDIFTADLKARESITLEKFGTIYTTRDKQYEGYTLRKLKTVGRKTAQKAADKGFEDACAKSASAWKNKVWKNMDARILSKDGYDQLAYRFAVYHLNVMTPAHDDRMNIGAKGISGPGYNGHAFWDTEMYMLPVFTFTRPEVARSLCISRYNGLDGAHRKAKAQGYEGAMFPWEAAWITDSDTTPAGCLTGEIEQHITADVAFGVHQYYSVTHDKQFMLDYGYELLFDTAKFWASRLEYNKKLDRYEINGVIGPDEFTENVNNNAYTNYIAHLNMELAVKYYDELKAAEPKLLAELSEKLDLDRVYPEWLEKLPKLYLPVANNDGIVPQDDTFLTLPDYDLTELKAGGPWPADLNTSIYQVSKQADVMVLFLILEDLFTSEVKEKNFYYYEKRCTHSSSLSLSSYTVLSADVGLSDMAYNLYGKAARIDLWDADMRSSDSGLHAASLGGIWQCTVYGFLGVRLYGQSLRIQPHLPKNWRKLSTKIMWHGCQLEVTADKQTLTVKQLNGEENVKFLCNGKEYAVDGKITIEY